MLDIYYPSLAAFLRDCIACGYDADSLLTHEYALTGLGSVVARCYNE